MSDQDYRFNDDLLISAEDRRLARKLYPRIFYALDDEALRAEFSGIDPAADGAKRRSRLLGSWAVVLVTFALLAASAEHLYAGLAPDWLAPFSGLCGIVGALIGWYGLLYARKRRLWLENRLRTEEMRLFHFRTILSLSDRILAGDRDGYLARRKNLFLAFQADVLRDASSALDSLLAAESGEDYVAVPIPETLPAGDPAIADELIDAYRRLRIQRQLNYARYKLRMDWKLFSRFPRQQAYWLGTLSLACVLGTIVAHLILLIMASFWGVGPAHGPATWVPLAGVWLAILALAFRTLEEGLQPSAEAERYRHYQAAVKSAGDRFESADTLRERLLGAQSLERASADEMRIFLRSTNEARFVM